MNSRYKNILFRVLLIVSSFDCGLMFARRAESVFICAVIGALAGVILCRLYSRSRQNVSKINKIISFAVGLFLCYFLLTSFYQMWVTVRTVKSIAGLLSLNAEVLMKILSVGMTLIAFPSVVCCLIQIYQGLAYCWRLIDIRKVWRLSICSFSVKSLLCVIVNVVGASVLGTVLLIGAYSLPVAPIDNQVSSSAKIFENEGYLSLFPWCTSQIDNFTDALMLMNASDNTVDSTPNKAMLNYRGGISDWGPMETLIAHYIKGIDYEWVGTYARYWHGYLVPLKPLLEFMDYGAIRILNAIVQLLLVSLVSFLMVWHKMKESVIPYLLSYLMLMPIALAKSLQFSTCFYILTFAMITILLFRNKGKTGCVSLIFLNIGIATSFFDFLTYPIATFGVPAVLFLLMHPDHALEQRLSNSLKSFFCWGIGYVGMWSLKWVISSLITGQNVIQNGLQAVTIRISNSSADGSEHFSILKCELDNVIAFLKTPFTILVAAFIIITIIRILRKKYITCREACERLMPYILIGLMPFLWYAFTTNHSTIHFWFTNKACVTSAFAIMCGLVELNSASPSNNGGKRLQI